MLPIDILMKEHRLIERMVEVMADEAKCIAAGNSPDTDFISSAVDFIRVYTDKCHHGKEENILFIYAAKKPLSKEMTRLLQELLDDHNFGRTTVSMLYSANRRYAQGDASAAGDIVKNIEALADFYPRHIEKEDKHFFPRSMDYFDQKEKEQMLNAFFAYDQSLIHKIYAQIVEKYEAKSAKNRYAV